MFKLNFKLETGGIVRGSENLWQVVVIVTDETHSSKNTKA